MCPALGIFSRNRISRVIVTKVRTFVVPVSNMKSYDVAENDSICSYF